MRLKRKGFTVIEILLYLAFSTVVISPIVIMLNSFLSNLTKQYSQIKMSVFVQEQLQGKSPTYLYLKKYDLENQEFDSVGYNRYYDTRSREYFGETFKYGEGMYTDWKGLIWDLGLSDKYKISGIEDVNTVYFTNNYIQNGVRSLAGVVSFIDETDLNRTCFFGQSYDLEHNKKGELRVNCILGSLFFIDHPQIIEENGSKDTNDDVYIMGFSSQRQGTDYKTNLKMIPLVPSSKDAELYN